MSEATSLTFGLRNIGAYATIAFNAEIGALSAHATRFIFLVSGSEQSRPIIVAAVRHPCAHDAAALPPTTPTVQRDIHHA